MLVFFGCSQLRHHSPALPCPNQYSGSLWPTSPEAQMHRFRHSPSSGLWVCMRVGTSLICTLPGACGLRHPPVVHSLPPNFRFGLNTRHSPEGVLDRLAARWREDWSCCCRGIPQSAPDGLFLFEKILLLNPAAPYKEGPVLSHSPPL